VSSFICKSHSKQFLKSARAKYVLGFDGNNLSDVDGQHPIIFMQCGSIRHLASKATRGTSNNGSHSKIFRNPFGVTA